MKEPFVFICIYLCRQYFQHWRQFDKSFEVPYAQEIALHLPFQHSGGLDKDAFWKLAIEQAEVTNGVTLTLCCSVVNSKHADSHHL